MVSGEEDPDVEDPDVEDPSIEDIVPLLIVLRNSLELVLPVV